MFLTSIAGSVSDKAITIYIGSIDRNEFLISSTSKLVIIIIKITIPIKGKNFFA